MAIVREPDPAKPFIGILYQDRSAVTDIISDLALLLDSEPILSQEFEFDFTKYYNSEMGSNLRKIYLVFSGLMPRENLVALKHRCRELEQATGSIIDGRFCRRINLDPGYLTPANFILSTFKDYSHRVFLGKGVFAEVTLIASKGSWHALPWTYPDYQLPAVQDFLWNARAVLLHQLDELRHTPKGKTQD